MFRATAEKWAKHQKLGRDRFVIRYGVLGWGLPTALIYSVLQGFREGWDTLPHLLLFSLIAFPLIGIWIGRLQWRWFEKQFGKAQEVDAVPSRAGTR